MALSKVLELLQPAGARFFLNTHNSHICIYILKHSGTIIEQGIINWYRKFWPLNWATEFFRNFQTCSNKKNHFQVYVVDNVSNIFIVFIQHNYVFYFRLQGLYCFIPVTLPRLLLYCFIHFCEMFKNQSIVKNQITFYMSSILASLDVVLGPGIFNWMQIWVLN